MRARLSPEKGLPADQLVELTWDHSADYPSTQESKPEFLVEMKQEDTNRWVPVLLAAPIVDTNIIVPLDMMAEGKNYQFRVAAKNVAGVSPFSTPSLRFQKRKLLQFRKELVEEAVVSYRCFL